MISDYQQRIFSGSSPEAHILLNCMRPNGDEEARRNTASLISDQLDWDNLQNLAEMHHLQALLYGHLKDVDCGLVPENVLSHLEQHYRYNQARNLALLRELIGLAQLLGEHRIPVIVLKGPLMAQSLYGNLALRWIGDLDLLVHPEDTLTVKEFMLARGYRPQKAYSAREERAFLRYSCEYEFINDATGVIVEIHWRLFHPHLMAGLIEDVWGRAIQFQLGGAPVGLLSKEDQFVYLCMHGHRHTWDSLRFLADIARAMANDCAIDWIKVMERTLHLKQMETVLLAMHMASAWLGTPLPPQVACSAKARTRLAMQAALIRGRVFRKHYGLPGYREWLAYLREDELARGNAGDLSHASPYRLIYLNLALRKLMGDIHYFLPSTPQWLKPMRTLAWKLRSLCFNFVRTFPDSRS